MVKSKLLPWLAAVRSLGPQLLVKGEEGEKFMTPTMATRSMEHERWMYNFAINHFYSNHVVFLCASFQFQFSSIFLTFFFRRLCVFFSSCLVWAVWFSASFFTFFGWRAPLIRHHREKEKWFSSLINLFLRSWNSVMCDEKTWNLFVYQNARTAASDGGEEILIVTIALWDGSVWDRVGKIIYLATLDL